MGCLGSGGAEDLLFGLVSLVGGVNASGLASSSLASSGDVVILM